MQHRCYHSTRNQCAACPFSSYNDISLSSVKKTKAFACWSHLNTSPTRTHYWVIIPIVFRQRRQLTVLWLANEAQDCRSVTKGRQFTCSLRVSRVKHNTIRSFCQKGLRDTSGKYLGSSYAEIPNMFRRSIFPIIYFKFYLFAEIISNLLKDALICYYNKG